MSNMIIDTQEAAVVAAWSRVFLRQFVKGDRVVLWTDGNTQEGTLTDISVDQMTGVVSTDNDTKQVELRDCDLLVPQGRREKVTCAPRETLPVMTLGNWQHEREVGYRERERKILVGSYEVPEGLRLAGVALSADIRDQNWGDTGHNGLILELERNTTEWSGSDQLFKLTYRRPLGSRYEFGYSQHFEAMKAALWFDQGRIAPIAGDTLKVFLHTVSWGGWSAHCKNVQLIGTVYNEVTLSIGDPLPNDWRSYRDEAFCKIWDLLNKDEELKVDGAHLQRVIQPYELEIEDTFVASLSERFEELLVQCRSRKVELPEATVIEDARNLLQRVESKRQSGGHGMLVRVAHSVLSILLSEDTKELTTHSCSVIQQWAEANQHCESRWIRESYILLSLVSGKATGLDALGCEEVVKLSLQELRQEIAESRLNSHQTVSLAQETHFENFFYGQLNFGLPNTEIARGDPSRFNYEGLDHRLPPPEELTRELMAQYTAEVMRQRIREKARSSQVYRDKLLDWLQKHVPPGITKETWLHEWVHDKESYAMKDNALNYCLCGMGVLKLSDSLC